MKLKSSLLLSKHWKATTLKLSMQLTYVQAFKVKKDNF